MSQKLYVGNLPFETTESDLQALFEQAGAVDSVTVMRDKMTGRARGFGFVQMASEEEAQRAIEQFNEKPFGGRTLTVNEARPQPDRPRPFGGGGGGGGRRPDRGRSGGGGGRRTEPRW